MNNKKFWVSLLAGIMAGIMILTLLLQLIPVPTQAATSSEIKNQIEQLEKEQAERQKELDRLEAQRKNNLSEMKDIINQKKIVDQQVALLYEQIDSMNDQIAAYAVMIADKQAELDKANEDLQEMKQKHMERLRAMEEDGSLSYWSVLFEANSFTDLLDRLNMIQEIANADQKRIEEMSEASKVVEQTRVTLQQEQAALQESRQEMAVKQVELDLKSKESEELLASLIAKGEEYEKWMAEEEDKLSNLEDELANMQVEYDRVKYQEWLATSVPPTTKPSSGSSSGSSSSSGNGEYSETIWRAGTAMTPNTVDGITWYTPCDYNRISSTFGMRFHPIDKIWKMHKGVDFAIGHTPIYASRPGVVALAGWDNSAGWWVVIDHVDGFRSVYMHMCKRPSVKNGDFVAAGQEIGCVGSTGSSTGNHLHFGIQLYNSSLGKYEYVNPLLYVK
jgi:murein DD-endopeptidase MepM/ murein hydrolase activator NlpD